MQHFFVEPSCIGGGEVVIGNDAGGAALLQQMKRVLRMRAGDKFVALDGSGEEFVCELVFLDGEKARAKIVEKLLNAAEPKTYLTLFQALPKKMELFELVLQKGTELGVSKFVPLVTEHGERDDFPKRDRLERILREAAEQSERGKIPELGDSLKFKNAIDNVSGGAAKNTGAKNILLHGRGDYPLLSSTIGDLGAACNIFVGPEGGFSELEVEMARENGFLIVSLGPRVLRTETAGIIAAGLVLLH